MATLSSAEVESLHRRLVDSLASHALLPAECRIQQEDPTKKWAKASSGKKLRFRLLYKQLPEVAMRVHDSPDHVFPLLLVPDFWLAWSDTWYVEEVGEFSLESVSLAVYVGPEGVPTKTQLFRAEWDDFDVEGEEKAAQPHWNIAHPVKLEESTILDWWTAEIPSETEVTNVSMEREMDREYDISRYHLGMSGLWDGPQPQLGWRRRFGLKEAALPVWLSFCLEYLAREIRKYRERVLDSKPG